MQNISAPTSEALSIKKLYAGAGALESPFVFNIPVYENMPGQACTAPTVSTNVVLALPEGYSDKSIWGGLPGRIQERETDSGGS